MNKEFEQFAELFDKNPNITILHINNNCDNINQFLLQLSHTFKGKFVQKDLSEIDFNRFRLTARVFEYDFRAPNPIDIFEKYDLVMAKKMHMWGNGL